MTSPTSEDADVVYFRDRLHRILYTEGRIHEIAGLVRLVKLLSIVPNPTGCIETWWRVEDVLTGQLFSWPQAEIGRPLVEMEVLAWASSR
jgi:hypothetical protein